MHKNDDPYKLRLSPEEYRVTRLKGTELPFTGEYLHNKATGDYLCKCCGAKLFNSSSKFDSGCGWPSFSEQSGDQNVIYKPDHSHGMTRIEILCKQCDAHLGHVFDDGPKPTGQRYCVNSISLDFKATE